MQWRNSFPASPEWPHLPMVRSKHCEIVTKWSHFQGHACTGKGVRRWHRECITFLVLSVQVGEVHISIHDHASLVWDQMYQLNPSHGLCSRISHTHSFQLKKMSKNKIGLKVASGETIYSWCIYSSFNQGGWKLKEFYSAAAQKSGKDTRITLIW